MRTLLISAVAAVVGWTAVPAHAAESSKCSKATATHVAKRLHFGYPPSPGASPIAQVVCGPFFGAGSRGMAFSIVIPSCGGSIQWGAFRYRSGTWRLVMKRNNGAELLAVGADIQERVYRLRAGDAHCFPSLQKTRLWHWNGKAFKASPWQVEPSATSAGDFLSPDRKIWCTLTTLTGLSAWCGTSDAAYSARLNADGALTVCDPSKGYGCLQNWNAKAPVLGDGHSVEVQGLRCTAAAGAMTCTLVATGKGFTISAGGVSPLGS